MEPLFPEDAVEVGRVAGAWGVKGWIKVQPFSLDPQALFSSKRWFLQAPPNAPAALNAAVGQHLLLKVLVAREHSDGVVAQVQDLQARDAAEALRGARIFVARASFPTAAEGEYYWVDLIGLTVVNRQGLALGEVVGLMETGAHDVLRVERPMEVAPSGPSGKGLPARKKECLIPFVAAYVDDVDLLGRCIVVDWDLDD